MSTLAERVIAAREKAGLTQGQLAERIGMTQQGIGAIEIGKSLNPQKLRQIARVLGVEESYLRGESAVVEIEPPKPVVQLVPGSALVTGLKMPVFAAAAAGDGHVIVSFDQIDEVKRPAELENVKGGYGLLVKGTSMVPALWEGDMALVNPHLPPARQRNVILYHTPPHGGEVEAIIKQLNGWTDREWHLQQYNPPDEFDEFRAEWPICHRVVGKYDGR